MSINRRSGIRKPLVLSIDVYSFDDYLGHTRTRDISLDGAFIERCSGKLDPDDMLELHFKIHDQRTPLRLRATVVRTTDEGAGVVFDYGVEEYRRLLDTITTYASDGHARKVPGFWYVNSSVS
jgi:hypothetical protein